MDPHGPQCRSAPAIGLVRWEVLIGIFGKGISTCQSDGYPGNYKSSLGSITDLVVAKDILDSYLGRCPPDRHRRLWEPLMDPFIIIIIIPDSIGLRSDWCHQLLANLVNTMNIS